VGPGRLEWQGDRPAIRAGQQISPQFPTFDRGEPAAVIRPSRRQQRRLDVAQRHAIVATYCDDLELPVADSQHERQFAAASGASRDSAGMQVRLGGEHGATASNIVATAAEPTADQDAASVA
jgi:hypothetical protein